MSMVNWLSRQVGIGKNQDDKLPVFKWMLDYPTAERDAQIDPAGRRVQGWLLMPEGEEDILRQVRIVVQWSCEQEGVYPLDIERPDVVETILKTVPADHPQRYCGFRFHIPVHIARFRLLLVIGEQRWLLKEIDVTPVDKAASTSLKVLKGKQGWLFLDNDTNASVDQFRGRLRLTDKGLDEWRCYLRGVDQLAKQQGIPWKMLIAPSKESVMGDAYHPYEASDGPMSQLLSLSEAKSILHPVSALKKLGDQAFIPTDTHWAQRGAMVASVALAKCLGLNARCYQHVLAKDRYVKHTMGGDLGNKLSPRQTSRVDVLRSFKYHPYRRYDNGLPNFGRIIVLEYLDAIAQGTALVFGSSSSYSMFNYLCRLFKRVIFVHSAGNLDPSVIEAIQPDYLIIQTNGRFVVQIPSLDQSLAETIRDKVSRLNDEEKTLVSERFIPADPTYLQEVGLERWDDYARKTLRC